MLQTKQVAPWLGKGTSGSHSPPLHLPLWITATLMGLFNTPLWGSCTEEALSQPS